MSVGLQDISNLILALVAVGGLLSGHVLSKRSKTKENELQGAANRLAERVQGFNELEKVIDRLEDESDRLREQLKEERELSARRHTEFLEMRSLVVGQVREEATRTAGEPVALPPADDDPDMGV